ncbi:pentapeptide repeat-containing protein [Actinomadura nitritigenes]|uniref:pentapeptide repeat-containing protein n=1 Tax=Actinomadura nitritigenes TaxID=134602 RepID=UPI003D93C1C3
MSEVAPHGAVDELDRPGGGSMAEREQAAGLWPIKRALTVASVTAVAGLVVVMTAVLAVLGFPHLQHTKALPLSQMLDVLKLVLGTVAGVGALFALVTAYRRQRLAEAAHDHAQRVDAIQQAHQERLARNAEHDAAERRITELYNAAAEQLGSDKAPVRLTALYTLERLANDNPQQRQTIVNIVCAYLRMPYTPPFAGRLGPEEEHRERARRAAARYRAARDFRPIPAEPQTQGPDPHEEHQVRLTAQRLLTTHLQPDAEHHWADISLDLTSATLTGFTLTDCTVHHADFSHTTLAGDTRFDGATFDGDTRFDGATFSGDTSFGKVTFSGRARFGRASFSGRTWFVGASFSRIAWFGGASFAEEARFDEVTFFGEARFGRASFAEKARFDRTSFSGDARFDGTAFAEDTGFVNATFSGDTWFSGAAFSGDTWFGGAAFSGGARFDEAAFSKATSFSGATFSRGASFGRAAFSGDTWFSGAAFSGDTWFGGAAFSGDTGFVRAIFSGDTRFREATFSGIANFHGAIFGAGVDMTSAAVADVAEGHVPPPNWRVEPSERGEGRFVRDSAPANGS